MVHMHNSKNDVNEPGKAIKSKQSNQLRMLLDAAAGSIAGCIARLCIGPLDVIKIRFQVQLEPIAHLRSPHSPPLPHTGTTAASAAASSQLNQQFGQAAASASSKSKYTGFRQALTTIVREEGIQGLWRGTVPGLLLTVPYTAVQFVALTQCKELAMRHGLTSHPQLGPLVSFTSGAMAGAAATVASYPFDLLRTTLAAQGQPPVYHGTMGAARGIVASQGIQGLYRGLGVTLLEIMPYAALQFGLYDALNAAANAAREHRLPPLPGTPRSKFSTTPVEHDSHKTPAAYDMRLQNFTCGLIAGLVAKLTTHPLDVAKKRYQVAGLARSLSYGQRVEAGFALRSLSDSLLHIYRLEGAAGLWKGSIPSIIKAAPSAAITFTAYEAVLAWLVAVNHASSSK